MFATHRSARLAAVLALVAGTSLASAGDDVIVQPDGTVVKPMPKRKQKKLERKIAKLSGGDVVVEGTPTVPVRQGLLSRPLLPRRETRTILPARRPATVVDVPAPIVAEGPLDLRPAASAAATSRPVVVNRPIVTSTPIVAETPITVGAPLLSTPARVEVITPAPRAADPAVNPTRGDEVVPPPVEIAPPAPAPAAEIVPGPAEPAEPALEPIKPPRDSA